MGFLFGDIFAVTPADLDWIYRRRRAGAGGAGLRVAAAAVAVACTRTWRPPRAPPVERVKFIFVLVLALVVAVAIKIVGVLLTIAFLIVPAVAARPLSETPEQMALFAAIFGRCRWRSGCSCPCRFDTPGGPSIVLVLSLFFVAAIFPTVLAAALCGGASVADGQAERPLGAMVKTSGTLGIVRLSVMRSKSQAMQGSADRSRSRHGAISIPVDVGGVIVGGDAPDRRAVDDQHRHRRHRGRRRARCAALARAGSEIVRITVDRDEAAKAVPHIRDRLAQMGVRRAAGRRLPLQRPHAAGREPRLRRGARQVPHQSRQRRLQGQARPAVLRHHRDGAASTPSRCASASTGAPSTRSC